MRLVRIALVAIGAFVATASPAQAYVTLFPDCVAKSDTDVHGRFGLYPFNYYEPVDAGFFESVNDSAGNYVDSSYRDVRLGYTNGSGAGEYSFTFKLAANQQPGLYTVTAYGDVGDVEAESTTLRVGGCDSVLFGKTSQGGAFSGMSADAKRASPFTLFAPATASRVYAYVDGKGSAGGSQVVRAVLYRNAGGPGSLVTRSFAVTIPAGASGHWQPFYLAPAVSLSPGKYWLGLQSGATHGVARFAWDSQPKARQFNLDAFADGSSSAFGPAAVDDQLMSIYAMGSY